MISLPFLDRNLFLSSLKRKANYFRVNTLKVSLKEFLNVVEFPNDHVFGPFFKAPKEVKLGNTWEYAAGLIHVQSLSSMLVPMFFDYSKIRKLLDMTAAPGGKTTEMAAFMNNKGIIVANDRKERIPAIRSNVLRLGVKNVVFSYYDAKALPFEEVFDAVLLDAPCTALGSHPFAWQRLTPGHVKSISSVQKVMILKAFDALKRGGQLIYSTCSVTKEENEDVVSFLLDKRPNAKLEKIHLDLPHERGISMEEAVRIYPWHFESEGFFVAKVVKG